MPGKTPRKVEAPAVWGLDDIREILDLLDERGISEFEMERNGFRVRIKREPVREALHHPTPVVHPETIPVVVGPPAMTSRPGQTLTRAPAAAQEPPPEPSEDLYIIKSPIVGTFYTSPGPDAPPFVKVGDTVRPGQVLCIIEAMKLMNEIEAEVAGEITRIFVEGGQPVEYGQSLFGVLPANSQ